MYPVLHGDLSSAGTTLSLREMQDLLCPCLSPCRWWHSPLVSPVLPCAQVVFHPGTFCLQPASSVPTCHCTMLTTHFSPAFTAVFHPASWLMTRHHKHFLLSLGACIDVAPAYISLIFYAHALCSDCYHLSATFIIPPQMSYTLDDLVEWVLYSSLDKQSLQGCSPGCLLSNCISPGSLLSQPVWLWFLLLWYHPTAQ